MRTAEYRIVNIEFRVTEKRFNSKFLVRYSKFNFFCHFSMTEGTPKTTKKQPRNPSGPLRFKSCWLGGEALRGYSQTLPACFTG